MQTDQAAQFPPGTHSALSMAGKFVLGYLLATGFWTVCLDFGLAGILTDPARLRFWQTVKDGVFIVATALILLYALKRLLQRQRQADQAFLAIQHGTAGAIGQDYFQFLTESLPQLLGTRACFVGEWDQEGDRLRILAGSPAEFIAQIAKSPLRETPCGEILRTGKAKILASRDLKTYPGCGDGFRDGISHFFGVPLVTPSGEVIGLLGTYSETHLKQPGRTMDILQAFAARAASELGRLRSERRNREYFNQLATVFDSLNAGIYVADMETYELLYVNRFMEEQFGKDWRHRPCYAYLQNGLEEACAFCTNSSLLVDGEPGPPVIWEFRNSRNNQWYQCLDKCIRWTDGRLVRLEIALDITPTKEMEQTKEEMLSAVSHEMRTPLTAITGFTELLLEEEGLPAGVKRHLQTILAEAEKMTDLVNTFLELRRLKADRSRVDYELLTVRELLEQGIRRSADCSERHDLNIQCPPELKVFGNRKELVQVVAKLLSNACRFSPAGGPVSLDVRREKDRVLLCFRDSGIGIPVEEHKKIFEHFHRLDRGDRRRTSGAGLGLSLVRETVELHGGQVWVESEPGRGSRFYVELPSYADGKSSQE